MEKYTIAIEETVVEEFEIEANVFSEALDIAIEKYYKGEIVLCSGEVQMKKTAVVKSDCDSIEWIEF